MEEHHLRRPNDRPKAEGTAALKFVSDTGSSPAPDPSLGLAPTLVEVNLDTPTLAEGTSPAGGRPDYSSELNRERILRPGAVLGRRYEILQLLGEGGMGSVYRARDREVNRIVALKVIRPELTGHPAILERFKQELVLSHQVTHKNVIRIYDLGDADGVKFITMEFVEGQDLRTLIQERKKFSPEEAVEITQQICRALEATHSVGVIHRDLKPQNIMRDKNGRILLMDFGLARMLEGDGMTQTGALVGTMEYMSPEQALGKNLDERSDLFTLGLIFYELLTGKMPFTADSALASLIKRTQERAAPISDHDNSIPGAVSAIVSKCLERDSNLRYKSSRELLADLEGWQGKAAAATLHFPDVRRWAPTAWPWIGMALAILVLAFVGIRYRDKLFAKTTQQVVVKPEVSLAILPFRNASGDTSLNWMGGTVAEVLRTDMGESASLRTVPSDRVNQILHDLRVEPEASLDPDTLRRVAEFTSADRLLWGQYTKLGGQIRIDATLQDLKRQRNFPLKAEASNEKELPNALQQLAESVEKSLALPPETIKDIQAKSLKPSSQSVQALRFYGAALQLSRQGKNLDAVKQFEAATKEDPNFALAYSKVAATYAALGYGDKAQEASRKAVDLSEKASSQEKYLIQAEDARVARDYPKAIASYENLAKISPDDSDVQYALGRLYEDTGTLDKARVNYDKLLALDPKNSDVLLRLGWVEIKGNNLRGSLDYLNRALTIAVQLGNEEEKALSLDAIGSAYQHMGKLDEALRNYEQALDLKRRLGDKAGTAETLNRIAEAHQYAGRLQQALKNFQEALRLHRAVGDKVGLAGDLLDLGNLYENLGKYDQALSLTKEALPVLREVGDRQNEAVCLNNIGWYYLDEADYENAMTYFQQALDLRQKVGSPADVADSLYNIGDTYARTGQYSKGLDHFLKALDLWRKAGDKRGIAFASYGLGKIFEYQGRYGAALTSEGDAFNSWRDVGESGFWLPEIQGAYGNALILIGRGEEAGKNLDEALARARELKNNPLIARILNFQGDRMFYRGDYKAAKSWFEQASQVAAHTTDREQILLSKFNLAKTAAKEERSQEAIKSFTAIVEQADKAGLKHLSVESSVYLAEAHIASKDYSRAREVVEPALRSSDQLGFPVLLAKTHYLLAQALRLGGKPEDAARHYTDARQVLDGIRKEANSDTVLKRSDLASVYQETIRWSQAPKT